MKRIISVFGYLRSRRYLVVLALVCALAAVGAKLAIPYIVGISLDQIRAGNMNLTNYLILIGVLIGIGSFARFFFDYLVSITGEAIISSMRKELYHKLVNAPVSTFDQKKEGDMLLLFTNDIDNIRTGFVSGAAAFFEGVMQIAITVGLMLYLNWLLALIVIGLTPLSLIVSNIISKANSSSFRKQNASLAELSAYGMESLANIETIQSYGLSKSRLERFKEKGVEVRKAQFKATFAAAWINPSSRLVNNMIYGAVVIAGCLLLYHQPAFLGKAFTVGFLSSFLTYCYQYMAPFNEIADASGDILFAFASFDRYQKVMAEESDDIGGELELPRGIDSVEGKNIVFGYDPGRVVLNGIHFRIEKGERVALVGTTGCGKTTIINLLMRFYDPQSGAIEVNEKAIPQYRKTSLREHIGMVLQQSVLFDGTIGENIAFGKEDASEEEILEACVKAKADNLIKRLPKGLDTQVSSLSLSSGERQLICLARILVCKPEFVLLDEATSNIDLRTEIALSGGFDTLLKGKTSVVVAHRLSTIVGADKILVMDKGKIIEVGNFKSLMEKDGFFAKLYHSQFA